MSVSRPTFDFYREYASGEARRLPSSGSEYKSLNMFEFIKAVSDIVFDVINVVYRDKPLVFNGATIHCPMIGDDLLPNAALIKIKGLS